MSAAFRATQDHPQDPQEGSWGDGRADSNPGPPPATRARARRWRDPRVVVGISLVALSVLLGAALLGRADDTVAVWSVRTSMRQGQPVTVADLTRTELGFPDGATANRYLSGSLPPPTGSVLSRDVGAGELLARGALVRAHTGPLTEVPLSVDAEDVPATVRAGSVVDVWVTPDSSASPSDAKAQAEASRVFDDVAVVAAPRTGTSLGPSSTRQVIVGVDGDQQAGLPHALAALSRGSVVLTRQR